MNKNIIVWIVALFLLSSVASSYDPYPSSDPFGVSSHYTLDNTANDEMGFRNGENIGGTYNNTETPFGSGYSLFLDGSNWKSFNSTYRDLWLDEAFTVCFWTRIVNPEDWDAYFGIDDDVRGRYHSANGYYWSVADAGGTDMINGNGVLTGQEQNLWRHSCWVHDDGTGADKLRHYVNGTLMASAVSSSTTVGHTKPTLDILFMNENVVGGSTTSMDGFIDDIIIFNDTALSVSDIETLFLGNYSIPLSLKLNISSSEPSNNTQFNTNTISFNLTVNSTVSPSFNCSLFVNQTLNTTKNYASASDVFVEFNVTFDEGDYEYLISCYNSSDFEDNNANTTTNRFYVDVSDPIITTDFINDSRFYKLLTGQFNFSDNILLHSFNFSIDGTQIYGMTELDTTFYSYNLSYDISGLSGESHTLTTRVEIGRAHV